MTDTFYLDIGGETFKTTKTTLMNIPYLDQLIAKGELKPDNKKHKYFIDQDPEDFKHVLKWARDAKYLIPHTVNTEFWGLKSITKDRRDHRICYKCGRDYGKDSIGRKICHEHVFLVADFPYYGCKFCGYETKYPEERMTRSGKIVLCYHYPG